MSAVYQRTRRQRRRAASSKSVGAVFAVADEPVLVLAYLYAADAARVATASSALRAACTAPGVAARLAQTRRTLALAGVDLGVAGARARHSLASVHALDGLDRAVAAWRVVRVKRRASRYEVVDAFRGPGSVGGESALLIHARNRVAVEVVGASNGWFRWSLDGVDGAGARPLTGTPPSWMDRNQLWDAEWPTFAARAEPVAAALASDGGGDRALPGNWALAVVGGSLAARNGNVWLDLTRDGFRTAQSQWRHAPEPADAAALRPVGDFKAKYGVAHVAGRDPAAGALDRDAPGPWAGVHEAAAQTVPW